MMFFDHNLGESSLLLLGKKNLLLFGVGMVVEKIKNDPNWRMWTTLASVLVLVLGYVTWSHANMISHIDLRVQPLLLLIDENTVARHNNDNYTEASAKEDKLVNRLDHQRLQKQLDHLAEMLTGHSRFQEEGRKMDGRILRLEAKVFK